MSGWMGPATITSVDDINHGVIQGKFRGSEMTIKLGEARRYLEYFIFLTSAGRYGFAPGNSLASAWSYIQKFLEVRTPGTSDFLGWQFAKGNRHPNPGAKGHPKLFDAC